MVRWLSRKQPRIRTSLTNRLTNLRRKLWLHTLEERSVPATFTVNVNTDDTSGLGGSGTTGDLRYCIVQANATPGADTIVFSPSVVAPITLGAELLVTDSVAIDGSAANPTISGSAIRLMKIDNSATTQIAVSLNKLTFTGGDASAATPAEGGAVFVANELVSIANCTFNTNTATNGGAVALAGVYGSLSINNSTFTGNNALTDGGAIHVRTNSTALTVSNSTFSTNTAADDGGAININGSFNNTFKIESSTFTGNIASAGTAGGGGGAIYASGFLAPAGASIRNTTIAGNTSLDDGGGIQFGGIFYGDLKIQNSTIVQNQAGISIGNNGGGIAFADVAAAAGGWGTISIQSTIISNNMADGPDDLYVNTHRLEIGNSAIGDSAGFRFNDLGGNLAFGATLFLDTLKNNGGPTQTILPLAGSPLVDRGSNPASLANDQRGLPRSFGAGPDIGAVELQTAPTIPFAVAATPDQVVGGGATYTVVVVYTDDVGINPATVDKTDLAIAGPNVTNPTPISVSSAVMGNKLTATYVFDAPDGVTTKAWGVDDNGQFTVTLNAGAVADSSGNPVPDGVVGKFRAAIQQTFVVNATNDEDFDSDGKTSLREAINAANATVDTNDRIIFDPAIFTSATTITLATGSQLFVTDSVRIENTTGKSITINANGNHRVMLIDGSTRRATTTISNLGFTGGKFTGGSNFDRGGAIQSIDDDLTLNNCIFTGNSVINPATAGTGADGGALSMYLGGILTINNCTFSNNSATGPAGNFADGGAIFAQRADTTIVESTLTGNSAFYAGGAIYLVNARTQIIRSTISGNVAEGTTVADTGGGGMYITGSANSTLIENTTISGNFAKHNGGGVQMRSSNYYNNLVIRNSTITNNRASSPTLNHGSGSGNSNGAGGLSLVRVLGSVTIESSIIAGNFGQNNNDIGAAGVVNAKNSAIGSLVGVGQFNDLGGNVIGGTLNLGGLADNGGPTRTHIAGFGSALINAGTNASSLATDQRGAGFPRVVGAAADIGAVESTGTAPVALTKAFADVNLSGGTDYTFTVKFLDDTGINAGTIAPANVRVTGPFGYSKLATFASFDVPSSTATYKVAAADNSDGGIWDPSDNGIYSVNIESGQVADSGGVFVAAGVVGNFRVRAFRVENNGDNGPGSLRQAILDSNSLFGADTITFNPAFFGAPTDIVLATEIPVSDPLTIQGGAGNLVTLKVSAAVRMLNISDGANGRFAPVFINNLNFDGGNSTAAASRGGAILIADDPVTVTDCVFKNNFAQGGGGAIAVNVSNGSLTVVRSLFENNTADTNGANLGGAIRVTTNGQLTMIDSTVRGNKAGLGGGIAVLNGSVNVAGSTISGNMATRTSTVTFNRYGGGVYLTGGGDPRGATFRNTTISGNTAEHNGGGVWISQTGPQVRFENCTITKNISNTVQTGSGGGGIRVVNSNVTVSLESTIVAGNDHTGGTADDINAGSVRVFARNSLIGVGDTLFTFVDQGSNLRGTSALPLDPLLGILANNGGPTQTHAVLAGSPAIDAGSNPSALTVDQIGNLRVNGPRADIGAVETTTGDLPQAVVTLPATVTTAGGTTFTVTVDYVDQTGIDDMSIDATDLTVSGPGGYGPVTADSVMKSGMGSKVTATYSFTAPLGGWTDANNGNVTVTLVGGSVSDVTANPVTVANRQLGAFAINIGKLFTVNSTADDSVTVGGLRKSILDANANPGVDTIMFDNAFFDGSQTITVGSVLNITEGLVIMGGGATKALITAAPNISMFSISGNGQFGVTLDGVRLFGGSSTTTTSGLAITVQDESLTINNSVIDSFVTNAGVTTAFNGGTINVAGGGNLTITNSTISNNTVKGSLVTGTGNGNGGAIFVARSASSLTIQNSTLSGNNVGRGGGAVYFAYGGNLSVEGSTLSGNSAFTRGGALYWGNRIGTGGFVIRNSTISNNAVTAAATSWGGAIAFSSTMNGNAIIRNSTITGNTIAYTGSTLGYGGGGIARLGAGGGQVTLESTIVARNTHNVGAGIFPDLSMNIPISANNSIIGVTNFNVVRLSTAGNQIGTLVAPVDPLLGPLANNGGPTQTHALLAGSPAIDKGSNPAGLAFDQRGMGFNRKSGAAVDIGAFEVQVAAAPPQVANITYNGGGVQRSLLQSIEITFSEAVTIMNPASAFSFVRYDKGVPTGPVGLNVSQVGNSVTITFNNSGTVALDPNSSVPDGQYQLTIVADQVTGAGGTLDGNKNGIPESNAIDSVTSKTHRLFGDGDGNGSVTAIDFNAFRLVYGTAGPSFFDFDGVGGVSAGDFNQFRLRYGVTGFLP